MEYRAYIPFDHVTGSPSSGCFASPYVQTTATYLGDQPAGSNPALPPTFRASIYSIVNPGNTSTPYSDATPTTGITYQFAPPSPANGSYISNIDYDGVFNDCFLENEEGQAQFGTNGQQSVFGSSLTATTATVLYNGTIANPLANNYLAIGWDVSTALNVNTSSSYVNIQVSGEVTCFPAAEILVDGVTVASYVPTSSNPAYIAGCLAGPDNTSLSGPATMSGGENLSY